MQTRYEGILFLWGLQEEQMKKVFQSLMTIVLLVICAAPVFSTEATSYINYNNKIGQLIFKELTLMEKTNELFNLWMKNDIPKEDAIKEINNILRVMGEVQSDIVNLHTEGSFQDLHRVYSASSDTLIESVKNHCAFIEKNDTKDNSIRDKIQQHLISYVDSVYACQKKNMEAQLAYQQQIKLDKESNNIKEYFDWNNKIIKIMLGQVTVSGDMERLLIKFSTGSLDNEDTLKEEKVLLSRARELKKELDSIKPAPSVRELNELFINSYDNYLTFHTSLADYLQAPSRDKSAKMQEDSRKANQLNFKFNEACFKFLEKNSQKQ